MTNTLHPTRLYIPPRTKLETVWRTVNSEGHAVWHVFTACADRNAPWGSMLGTAMQLNADGSVDRYTVREDHEQYMEIMPKIGEK